MKRNLIYKTISGLLLLFVYLAFSKLYNYTSFKPFSGQSLLGGSEAVVVALAIPITVSPVSVSLFFRGQRLRLRGPRGSFVTITIITLYLACMIFFTPTLSRSCDGLLKQITANQFLILTIFFLALSLVGIALKRNWIKLKPEWNYHQQGSRDNSFPGWLALTKH
jgi:hypothetical protein